MWVLYTNFCLYLSALIYYKFKDGIFSINVFVLSLYCLFSISGIICIQNGIYFNMFGIFDLAQLSIVPYIFNFILVLFLLYNIPNVNLTKIKTLKLLNSRLILYIESFFILLSIIFLYLQYVWYQAFSSVELADLYERGYTGEVDQYVFSSSILRVIYYRSKALLDYAVPFFYLIEFAKISFGNNYKKPLIIILLMFLPQILLGYFSASRGIIVFQVANLFFFIIYFWKYLPLKVKSLIVSSFLLFSFLIVISVLAISISRAGEDSDIATMEIFRYFGEPFPNLGLRVWNVDGIHLYGMRKFPTIYSLFADIPRSIESYNNPNLFYEAYSKYPIQNFKTLFGDLYCEWGIILSFAIVVLFTMYALFLKRIIHNSLFSLIILFCIYRVLVYGLFNANITQDTIINMTVLFFIAVYFKRKTVNTI